jgi:hypothetical protein
MSDYEYHKGKLRKLELKAGQSLADLAKSILVEKGKNVDPDSTDKEVIENFRDTYWKGEFLVANGSIYAVDDHTRSNECPEIADLSPLPDGRIAFTAYFYNGGACFEEVIEEALSGIDAKV